jgi:uncharacterized protein
MADHSLQEAIFSGDVSEVQRLIIENPALVEYRHVNGRSPLMVAASIRDAGMVVCLIDRAVDIHTKDLSGEDALFVACRRGHAAVVSILLDKGMDINTRDRYGMVPLMRAAFFERMDVLEILLSRKDLDIDRQDNDGWTALWQTAGRITRMWPDYS